MIFDKRTAPLHFAVRPLVVLYYLGQILLASALLMTVPLFVAFMSGNYAVAWLYVVAIGLVAAIGGLGAIQKKPDRLQKNEALCIAALTFIVSSFAAAIPLSGYGLAPIDAWFDAVSAVTTTGLSTIPSVEDMPFSFHFGRSWTQWVGGLGVLVLGLAVMLQPGVATNQLGFDDRETDDVAGGTRSHAQRILISYIVVTAVSILVVWLSGMPIAEAVTDTLAAVSTGGFAARDSSLGGLSPWSVAAVSFACFLGAVPFYIYYRKLYGGWRRVVLDPQFVILVVVLITGVFLVYGLMAVYRQDGSIATLGHAAAMAVSAQTTAGFSTVSIDSMGPAAALAMCGLMFVGGGLGSTAGGIKILRFIILLRLFQLLLVRASTTLNTKAKIRLGDRPVAQIEVEAILGVVFAYIATIFVSWMAFVAAGYDGIASLFEVTSATGTAGISAGVTSNDLPVFLKLVLILDMLLGRVETVAVIVLLFPGTWFGNRRRT